MTSQTLLSQLKAKLKVPRHGHTVSDDVTEEDEDADDITKEEYLTRDEFNLHKMIVAMSSAGKVRFLFFIRSGPHFDYNKLWKET